MARGVEKAQINSFCNNLSIYVSLSLFLTLTIPLYLTLSLSLCSGVLQPFTSLGSDTYVHEHIDCQ